MNSDISRSLLENPHQPQMLPRGFALLAGQGRLFEMAELNQSYFALAGNIFSQGLPVHLSGQWERLGSGLFQEDNVEGQILVGRNKPWGLSGHWWRQTLGGESAESVLNIGFLWEVDFQVQNLSGRFQVHWPLRTAGALPDSGRRENLIKLTLMVPFLAAGVVVDRHDDGTPHLGFHLLAAVEGGVGLEFRVDPATGSLGPGISLIRGRLMLRTSHVIHPHLGITHRMMLVVGRNGGES